MNNPLAQKAQYYLNESHRLNEEVKQEQEYSELLENILLELLSEEELHTLLEMDPNANAPWRKKRKLEPGKHGPLDYGTLLARRDKLNDPSINHPKFGLNKAQKQASKMKKLGTPEGNDAAQRLRDFDFARTLGRTAQEPDRRVRLDPIAAEAGRPGPLVFSSRDGERPNVFKRLARHAALKRAGL
jgi:hypothetical protein